MDDIVPHEANVTGTILQQPAASIKITAPELNALLKGCTLQMMINGQPISIQCPVVMPHLTAEATHQHQSSQSSQGLSSHRAALIRPDSTSPTLLGIPRELRDQIYDHIWASETIKLQRGNRHTRNTGVLGASKQIRAEAIRVYYGRRTFRIRSLALWLGHLRQDSQRELRDVQVDDWPHSARWENVQRMEDVNTIVARHGSTEIAKGVFKIRTTHGHPFPILSPIKDLDRDQDGKAIWKSVNVTGQVSPSLFSSIEVVVGLLLFLSTIGGLVLVAFALSHHVNQEAANQTVGHQSIHVHSFPTEPIEDPIIFFASSNGCGRKWLSSDTGLWYEGRFDEGTCHSIKTWAHSEHSRTDKLLPHASGGVGDEGVTER